MTLPEAPETRDISMTAHEGSCSAQVAGRAEGRIARVQTLFRSALAGLRGQLSSFGYGFVAQVLSALMSFLLVVLASRTLGTDGLGIVSVGFAAYLVVLGAGRSLISEPLVAGSSSIRAPERRLADGSALTCTLLGGIVATGVFASAGGLASADVARGLLLFSPWLAGALGQDLARAVLFRDGRGRAAAAADLVAFTSMLALVPLAVASGTDWAVVGCWGGGVLAGAILGSILIAWRPLSLRACLTWWTRSAWPFGRWLLLSGSAYNIAAFATVLILVGILGASDLGGLRAVQVLFAPLTLLLPALSLPGFPLVSRLAPEHARTALALAVTLGGCAALGTAAYLIIVAGFPDLLGVVFGREFLEFESLVVPVGVGQVLAAPAFGGMLFLRARQRGTAIAFMTVSSAMVLFGSSALLAARFGLSGAAWANAVTALVGGLLLVGLLRTEVKRLT
jgi:O-antigen/teichoic acid export membrane protein